jgi:hypothetical protein
MKLELLTNATVVDDVIRFVHSNRNFSASEYISNEMNEPTNGGKEKLGGRERDLALAQNRSAVTTINKTF